MAAETGKLMLQLGDQDITAGQLRRQRGDQSFEESRVVGQVFFNRKTACCLQKIWTKQNKIT